MAPLIVAGDTDAVAADVLRAPLATRVLGDEEHAAAGVGAARPVTPEEIAAGILFLVSDDASFVHGAVLAIDGGRAAT